MKYLDLIVSLVFSSPHLLGCTVYIVEELLLAVCMFVSCIGMIGYQCSILLVCENLFLNKSPSIC